MFLRMLYDDKLAQAAYLIGCQRCGEAIVFDPERDVDRYLDAAAKAKLRIVAVAETHIHADFLSGARELAERTGAKVYVSAEGGPDWTSRWLHQKRGGGAYDHRALRDGDTFAVGAIEFRALHTPGHTPEHLCYLVTDRGGGATDPMGVVSGDFVFVGDLGRPDLLETAAGQSGAKEPAARDLLASVRRFTELPDWLQVWPAHGAGSACGKALGAVPQSTVGYEKRYNPAIKAAAEGERPFIDAILHGQPEPPLYFARMKRLNRDGPPILGALPAPERLTADALGALDTRAAALIDTRPWAAFRAGHIPGSLHMPLDAGFPAVAGSYIREDEPIRLIVEASRLDEAIRDLVRIGLDRVEAWADPADLAALQAAGAPLEPAAEITADELPAATASGALVLDVRRAAEFDAGHIPGALHATHTDLPRRLADLPKDRPIVVQCQSGVRSARATAYLQREGFDVTNLTGGYAAWKAAGSPAPAHPQPSP